MLKKLIHILTSRPNKGFGIHSPFVFEFQREVFHPNGRKKHLLHKEVEGETNKTVRLLLSIYAYYEVQDVLLTEEFAQKVFEKYRIAYDKEIEEAKKYGLVVLDTSRNLHKINLQNVAFVVLKGSRTEILNNPLRKKCTVFLDLYEIGICIFNEALSRQEFKLKL